MCGIAGKWSPADNDPPRASVEVALGHIRHRGPDGEGLHDLDTPGGRLTLGHRRLSIIDLSDDGLQPMVSQDGRLALSYNGEIYNYLELRADLAARGHVFTTATDTEVLLHAWQEWGPDCLTRLDGMFAFALFDRAANRLHCVRDAFGIKPLFFHASATSFAFASEMPAMLAMLGGPHRINRQRAYQFLMWGDHDDDESSFYEGIVQLRPAERLEIDFADGKASAPRIERWWFPDISERTDLSLNQAADQLRHLFLGSVRRQLRSDVPLGINLSGGIDSSAIACAVRHLEPDFPISTFTYGAGTRDLNEEGWAGLVNDHIGARSYRTDDHSEDYVSELDDVIRAQGEPFGSQSIVASYRIFRLVKQSGVTVTLDGQGGDELLGGYWGYPSARMASLFEQRRLMALARYASAWKSLPGCDWRQLALQAGEAFVPDRLRASALRLANRNPEPAWLDVDRFASAGGETRPPKQLPHAADARGRRLAERLRSALTVNRLPALLRYGDRNSMRWSIESRVPFLSLELANFALRLPEHYLVSPEAETKHVFRRAMRGIVPDVILDRKDKIGFATPERLTLQQNWSTLSGWLDGAEQIDFLKAGAIRTDVEAMVSGRARFSFRAWRLLNFCRWVQLAEQDVR